MIVSKDQAEFNRRQVDILKHIGASVTDADFSFDRKLDNMASSYDCLAWYDSYTVKFNDRILGEDVSISLIFAYWPPAAGDEESENLCGESLNIDAPKINVAIFQSEILDVPWGNDGTYQTSILDALAKYKENVLLRGKSLEQMTEERGLVKKTLFGYLSVPPASESEMAGAVEQALYQLGDAPAVEIREVADKISLDVHYDTSLVGGHFHKEYDPLVASEISDDDILHAERVKSMPWENIEIACLKLKQLNWRHDASLFISDIEQIIQDYQE
jgi:hypothetical protein